MATTRAAIKARAKAIFEEGITGVVPDTAVDGGWNDIINAAMDIVAVDAMCIKGKITLATLKDAVASVTVAGTADTTATPVTTITAEGATAVATATVSATGAITALTFVSGGTTGWHVGDLMTVTHSITVPTGSGALAKVATLNVAALATMTVVRGGANFTAAAGGITLTPYASGAKATALISSSGDITSVRVTDGGRYYNTIPTVSVAGASNRTTTAVMGVRDSYNITDGNDDVMLFIEEVTYNGQTIDPMADDDLTASNQKWRDQSAGTPRYYYVEGITPSASIVLYPKPSGVGETIEVFGRIRPRPLPLAISSDTQYMEISSPFDMLVVWKAVQLACGQAMSDPMAAVTKMQLAERQYLMNLDKFKGLSAWPDGRSLVKASSPRRDGWPPAYGRTEYM